MKLQKGESIITAYGESCSGLGWTNHPIWVLILRADGSIQEACIQPEDQTAEMLYLYGLSCAIHFKMKAAVAAMVKR